MKFNKFGDFGKAKLSQNGPVLKGSRSQVRSGFSLNQESFKNMNFIRDRQGLLKGHELTILSGLNSSGRIQNYDFNENQLRQVSGLIRIINERSRLSAPVPVKRSYIKAPQNSVPNNIGNSIDLAGLNKQLELFHKKKA